VWQRFFLDYVALGISIYVLYSYSLRREMLADSVAGTDSVDPLLFLGSSLFIVGIGLMFIRFFPYIIKLFYTIFQRFWSPALYSSLLKIVRSSGEEQFIMIFLLFTLSIGVFNAKAARTLNINAEDKVHYVIGTDIVLSEQWQDNMILTERGFVRPPNMIYTEPDFERYLSLDGVETATKVLRRTVNVSSSGMRRDNVQLIAVDALPFSEVLWFRDDLLPVHIHEYINAMSSIPNGLLLSSNFKENHLYTLGAPLEFRDPEGGFYSGVIVGFIDYWPGFEPQVLVTDARSGDTSVHENFLIVANYLSVNLVFGSIPYEVWIKLEDGASAGTLVYFAEENDISFLTYRNTMGEIIDIRNDPIQQGVNGVLTVGFIVVLLIAFIGFQIYWILSIKARTLQFGIFRAMGMSMRNIFSILISEQFIISFVAVGVGALIGEFASRLFVPLLQLSYQTHEQVLPLRIITERQDYMNLFAVSGIMILLCMIILSVVITRTKITEALKLGED
jgi:putative ABC transport system permease protein